MATPRKRIVTLTVSVWLAAAGSAAALTYELNRPWDGERPALMVVGPASPRAPALETVEAIASSVVLLPPAHIVAQAPPRHRVARADKALPAPRDISAMSCADWRDLDMGSGHVQVCQ